MLLVPSLAAMLRIWVLTVSGDRFSRAEMALRSSPQTMSCRTSRSLSVSWMNSCASGPASGLSGAPRTAESRFAGNHVPPSTAARTAVTMCSAGPSLDTKPTAPA